jgi:alkylation response protein AidB-like acyl-CoA dehydrogenase
MADSEGAFEPSALIIDQATKLLGDLAAPGRLRALLDQPGGCDRELWRKVVELGWIAAALPEAIGGFGFGWSIVGALARISGRYTASIPLASGVIAARALHAAGMDDVAALIAGGEVMAALALGGPGADIDATPRLDRGRLNGIAPYTAFASVADYLLVTVRHGDGLALAWVDLNADGVRRSVGPTIDNARAAAALIFDGAGALLVGDAGAVRQAQMAAGVIVAFEQIGGAERCLELSCDYARERKAFGQPIGAFQAVKHKLADFYTAIELARGCANAAMADLEAGSDRLRRSAPAARMAATDAFEFAATETIQVFGAIGVTWEAAPHHYYVRSRALAVECGGRIEWRDALVDALTDGEPAISSGSPPAAGAAANDLDRYRARVADWLACHAPAYEINGAMSVAEKLALGRRWQALKAANGYSAITLPRDYGGGGGGELERIAFAEEELRYSLPTVFFSVSLNMTVPTFAIYASDQAKARLLPPAIRGDHIWCQLFSEPAAGSDLAGLRLSARRDGDGWRLNGQKVWTSWAQFSDWGYIAARTDPALPKHKGLTCFYLDMKSPGITVRPIRRIGGEQEINEVFFDDVYVPDIQRMGAINGGFEVILTTLMIERYALNDAFAGGPKLDQFIDLAKRSRIRGRAALEEGEVRRTIGDSYVEWLGQQSIHANALAAMAAGAEPGPEGAIRKLLAAKSRQRLATAAIDLKGLEGLALDPSGNERGDFTRSWIDAPQLRIAGGTDDILRNTIAEKILRLPQDYRPDKGVAFNAIG